MTVARGRCGYLEVEIGRSRAPAAWGELPGREQLQGPGGGSSAAGAGEGGMAPSTFAGEEEGRKRKWPPRVTRARDGGLEGGNSKWIYLETFGREEKEVKV